MENLGLLYAGDSSLWTYGEVTTNVACKILVPYILCHSGRHLSQWLLEESPFSSQMSLLTTALVVLRDTKLITTATTPGVTLDPDTLLYIRPTTDKVLSVGFTGNGDITPSDAVCDGFIRYGPYLMWESDNSLSDSFRMKITNVSGVYQVYWDTSNLFPSGYLLPIVKILQI